ncbi:MAG: hypothetical protein D6812_15740 [Deltaproteobacteria bacterium]|nr:MAG: hypothetical protein D6812_15740 [Deltaproteobacteria bacterium]
MTRRRRGEGKPLHLLLLLGYGAVAFAAGFLLHRSGLVWRMRHHFTSRGERALSVAPVLRHDFRRLSAIIPRYHATGKDLEHWESFVAEARKALRDLLQLETPPPPPLARKLGEEIRPEGIVLERWRLRVAHDLEIPLALLRPAGLTAPAPGVIYLHGHGPGSRGALGEIEDYHQAGALELARHGIVVIVPEHRGFGETGATGWGDDPVHILDIRIHLALGHPLLGRFLHDSAIALSFLAHRPEVDATRLGASGVSLGGILALFLGALDPRIEAVAASAALQNQRDLLRRLPPVADPLTEFDIPGFLVRFDFEDVAALVAPRHLLIDLDPTDQRLYRAPWTHLERVYHALGHPQRLTLHLHDGGHRQSAPVVAAWMAEVLHPPR